MFFVFIFMSITLGMYRLMNKFLVFILVTSFFAFAPATSPTEEAVNVKKTIKKVGEHLFQLSIVVENGAKINGIAKYEAKLPLTADFVKEVRKDNAINFKIDGRKVKMIWMHLQKNESYEAVFQFRSKLSISKLRMTGKLMGHENGNRVTIPDHSALNVANVE